MALPFFYEPDLPVSPGHFTLGEETSKHCIQVLRMKAGSRLLLTDGLGRMSETSILSEDKKKTVVQLTNVFQVPVPVKKVRICISLLKNTSRFEWFLEKATEIGIREIQPLLCDRTEHTRMRTDRMKNILSAAMLQSQQAWMPLLKEPIALEKALQPSGYSQKLIAHCAETSRQYIKDLGPSLETEILIGPEGDFSPEEIQMAIEKQYAPVTLGETRLRAETAGVVAATLLMIS